MVKVYYGRLKTKMLYALVIFRSFPRDHGHDLEIEITMLENK